MPHTVTQQRISVVKFAMISCQSTLALQDGDGNVIVTRIKSVVSVESKYLWPYIVGAQFITNFFVKFRHNDKLYLTSCGIIQHNENKKENYQNLINVAQLIINKS